MEHLIKIASDEGDVVFDPFMGVGSTDVAALALGQQFIGVDVEKGTVNAARKRIDELKQQLAEATEEEAALLLGGLPPATA